MKNIRPIFKLLIVMLFIGTIVNGCAEDNGFDDINLDLDREVNILDFEVDDALEVDIDEARKRIVITYPGGTDVSQITPRFSVSEGAQVSPAPGTAVDLRSPQTYTITNGNLFSTYTVTANVLSVTAFLSHHQSVQDIQDDDEQAYAEWFFNRYGEDVSAFVSFQDIKDGNVDLSQFKTLTWYLDGNENEEFRMPEIALDPEVLTAITDWYKEGGNLYLLGYANQYLWEMGRIQSDYYRIIGQGQGFENPDTWVVNTNIGRRHNMSDHPLFADISMTEVDGRAEFPVIGPGWKEDHNFVIERIPEYMVDFEGVAADPNNFNGNEAAYEAFVNNNNAEWLATWGGINDYFMAGILEFKPNNEFRGTAIFQGLAAIEWNQNAMGEINTQGANPHQGNIEQLAINAISYLSIQ